MVIKLSKLMLREPVQFSWIDEIKKITSFGELYAGMQSRILREIAFATISAGSFLALMKLIHLLQTDLLQADPIERVMEYISNVWGKVINYIFFKTTKSIEMIII